MKILIVYTHPNSKSLNGAFLENVVQGLNENASVEKITTLDLYKEKFDPALVFNETKRRRDMDKDPELAKYRGQILDADTLIFIYPIWWGRPPAMLLGYIDKVFASGFAYKIRPKKLSPDGLLKGKRAICISTMKGPTGYPALLLGNGHKKIMRVGLFQFVGIKRVKFFEQGNMEKKNGRQKKQLKKIKSYMSKLKRI